MQIMKLNDYGVQRARCSQDALRQAKLLGRGTFGAVFEGSKPGRVFKLTTDRSHRDYLVDGLSPEGVYKPKVFEDFDEVGETSKGYSLYLFEMERLQPIRRGTANGRLARRIVNFVGAAKRCPEMDDKGWDDLPPALFRFMEDLNMFISNFDCRYDMHWKNFMERDDGTLVFSDPVLDYVLFERSIGWRH